MRAQARAEAVRSDGRTRLAVLRSEPPLTLRDTPDGLHLVGTSAGPLGGDDLRLDLVVGNGARLSLRSAAAQLVMPGPTGGTSRLHVRAIVGADADLVARPEPTVAVGGCDHRAETTIDLGPGASLTWREVLVAGRCGEGPGSVLSRLHVDRVDADGVAAPLVRHEVALGPRWPEWSAPSVLGGAGAVGSVLFVGPSAPAVEVPPPVAGATVEALQVGTGTTLVLAVGATAGAVTRALDAVHLPAARDHVPG